MSLNSAMRASIDVCVHLEALEVQVRALIKLGAI